MHWLSSKLFSRSVSPSDKPSPASSSSGTATLCYTIIYSWLILPPVSVYTIRLYLLESTQLKILTRSVRTEVSPLVFIHKQIHLFSNLYFLNFF